MPSGTRAIVSLQGLEAPGPEGLVEGQVRLEGGRIGGGRLDKAAILGQNRIGGAGGPRVDAGVESDAEATVLLDHDLLESLEEFHGSEETSIGGGKSPAAALNLARRCSHSRAILATTRGDTYWPCFLEPQAIY